MFWFFPLAKKNPPAMLFDMGRRISFLIFSFFIFWLSKPLFLTSTYSKISVSVSLNNLTLTYL